MPSNFLDRTATCGPSGIPSLCLQPEDITQMDGWNVGYDDTINTSRMPLPDDNDNLGQYAPYIAVDIAEKITEEMYSHAKRNGNIGGNGGGNGEESGEFDEFDLGYIYDKLGDMVKDSLSDVGINDASFANKMANKISNTIGKGGLAAAQNGIGNSPLDKFASMLAGRIAQAALSAIRNAMSKNAYSPSTSLGIAQKILGVIEEMLDELQASTTSEMGTSNGDEPIDPEKKPLEFLNDLDFLTQELEPKNDGPEKPVIEDEYPLFYPESLIWSTMYEDFNQIHSTYDGYEEEHVSESQQLENPKISLPGYWSHLDEIESDIRKVKHKSLITIEEAQALLKSVSWMFTFDPNRAREANRRARHLKKSIFNVVRKIPSMLDLWDGLGEWTSTYVMKNELDKSQLPMEKWGRYLGGTDYTPRIMRNSQWRKYFDEDRRVIQKCYDKTNEFMQYCMSNAYAFDEKVENGTFYENTTTYVNKGLTKVGRKIKSDDFFHSVIMWVANPYPISTMVIGLSRYLIDYIEHKVEIVKINTYDLDARIDGRRLSLIDYRGFKRMNEFTTLDRSGLDVIDNE